jgi:hypothetical protein
MLTANYTFVAMGKEDFTTEGTDTIEKRKTWP